MKYRANTLAAILQDWESMGTIMSYYDKGAGSMLVESQKTLQSLQANLTNLKTSGQEFFSKFFDTDKATDFLKVLTNITQSLTNLVGKLGAIPTILGTIGATALLKNGGMFVELGRSMSAVENIWNSIATQGKRGLSDSKNIEALANSVKRLNADQQAYIITAKTGNQVLARQALETNNLTESEINNAMAKVGLMNTTRGLSKVELEEALNAQLGNEEKARELAQTISLASAQEMEKVSLEQLTYAQLQAKLMAQGLTQEQAILVGTALGYSGAIDGEVLAVRNLSFAQLEAKLQQVGLNQEQIKGTGIALGFSSAATKETLAIKGLSYAELEAKLQQAGLNAEQIKAIATQLGYTSTTIGATAATSAFSGVLSLAILQIKKAVIALKSLVLAHPIITAITAAITIGVVAWKKYKEELAETDERFKEALQNIKERRDSLKQEVDDIQSVSDEYEELGQKTNLTSDEKERLVELQKQLNQSYDTELRGIDLVNGKYDEQIEKIKTLNKEKQRELLQQTQIARHAAENAYLANNADMLIDKQISKALGNDFENDFYSQFVDAVFKRNIKGVSFDINGGINISDSLNAEEKVSALKAIQETLDRVTTAEDKSKNSIVLLNSKINSLIEEYSNEVDEYHSLLGEELELIVNEFEYNGETVKNLTIENALAWKSALINAFAKDDPKLRQAIEDYYHYNIIPEISRRNKEVEEIVEPIDLTTWLNSDELSDVEKILGKIQTAYKNLAEGGTGFELDDDVLKQFPELTQYLDDTDKLKEKLQEVANTKIQPLLDQLIQLRDTLTVGSEEYNSVKNTILWLQKQADVTNKLKEEKEKATKVSDLYKDQKLQIHENIQALEREVKTIDKQISALEKKKDLQEKYIKTLEKEKDRLEDLIDDYETAASVVKDFIDEQNDALEKQKDNIEDTYEAQIKAIEETYEKQVKLLETQEEGFDKQIKALQDEADEQDRLNDLKEKELALEKAKNEKIRVYDSSKGWIITENSEEVAKKRKELEEAQHENKIAELEKEKERLESEKERLQAEKEQRTSELEAIRDKEIAALQAEMDKLKEYKEAWEEAIGAYKKAQEEMTAAAILGADWRTKLAEQDKTIIEDYKNGYEGVQNQLNNSVIPMIELANKELDTYSEQIDKLKEQKDLYKDMEDNQKKYLDFYKTYAEQFATATKEQSDAVEALNKALATNTLLTNMNDTDKAWDWAKSLFDEDYIREYPDYYGGQGLIGKLKDIFDKSTSVYDSFIKSMPDLLNKTSSDLSGQVMAGAKMIAETVTNNKSNNDNRTQTININNPGFAITEAAFMTMLTSAFAQLNKESQIGKK